MAQQRTYRRGAARLSDVDYSDPDAMYFVTVCSEQRQTAFRDDRLAQGVIDTIYWLRANRGLRVYAYCLMPDHCHLLLQSPQRLGEVVRSLKVETTRQYRVLGHTGKLWQDRYYDHVVRDAEDVAAIAFYILGNPVRKGLAEEIEVPVERDA